MNFSDYLLDGKYIWYVNCTDTLGNINISEKRLINIDGIGPSAVFINVVNFSNLTKTITLNASVNDTGIGVNATVFYYRLNSSTFWVQACADIDGAAPYQCSWNTLLITDSLRSYKLMVYANDSLNNPSVNDTKYNITIDNTPPDINLELPNNNSWSLRNTTFFYNTSDAYFDIANCSLAINNTLNLTIASITEQTSMNFSD